MTSTDTPPEPETTPRWVTIGEAAALLDQSAKTIRRKIKAGDLVAEMRHDPEIGGDRWYIDADQLPRQPGTIAALVPVEILDRLEEAWREAREATAEAARASLTAEFERERRIRATDALETTKAEIERLRALRWWQRRG